jgi:hypothetical protein
MLDSVVALYNSGRELGLVPAPLKDGSLLMRRALLVMATMLFAVFMIGGVAYALTIQCDGTGDQDPDEGVCFGTDKSDTITGTLDPDFIVGFGGRDSVFGEGGNDTVDGFGDNDVIHGGPGDDGRTRGNPHFDDLNLEGAEQSDVVYGEEGNDIIDAAANDTAHSRDRSFGGADADTILAADGNKDLIECGAGQDTVTADANDLINGVAASSQDDPIGDCETVNVVL